MALSAVHSEHSVTAAVREYLTVLGCNIGEFNVVVWVYSSFDSKKKKREKRKTEACPAVILLQVLPRERREGVQMTQIWISSVESSSAFQTVLKPCLQSECALRSCLWLAQCFAIAFYRSVSLDVLM